MKRSTKSRGGKTGRQRSKILESKRHKESEPRRPRGSPSSSSDTDVSGLARKLEEALEKEAASGYVLRIISQSRGGLKPVFDAMLENAARICRAEFGRMALFDGKVFRTAAVFGGTPEFARFLAENPEGSGGLLGQVASERRAVHLVDVMAGPGFRSGNPFAVAAVEVGGARSAIAVPLLRDQTLIGGLVLYRQRVEAFSESQIALVSTFADQAVIAIENTRLITETREALEQQTATAEVLQVINSSPGALAPVFEAMLEKATRVCNADAGILCTYDGECFVPMAVRGFGEFPRGPIRPHPETGIGRIERGEDIVHFVDSASGDPYESGDPARLAIVQLGGARSQLTAALRKDGRLLGSFTIWRREVRPFSEKQIALLQNFAAQAVIAMENARLISETREALDQQTATAEVLQVINSSPGNLVPVFDAMLEKAMRLCEAAFGHLATYDGARFHTVAIRGVPAPFAEFRKQNQSIYGPGTATARLLAGERFVHFIDTADTDAYRYGDANQRAIVDLGGARSMLVVPLLKDEAVQGFITIYRQEVRPFSDKQIALLQNFAAQAVIAIENARLLGELRSRTAELTRSVDELTATGDVLKIISRSSVDLSKVLNTLVETVARLCRADQAYMFRRQGDLHHLVAAHGLSDEAEEFTRTHPFEPSRGTLSGRVALSRQTVHIADVLQDPEYTYLEGQRLAGFRTMLGIPLLREDTLVGVFVVTRTRVDPFTSKEIELAATFADQAVIAIENARLFDELRGRQAELRVTFDNMGDGVVMFDQELRLTAWNRNFQQILDLSDAVLAARPSYADYIRLLAERGEFGTENVEAELTRRLKSTDRAFRAERTRPDGRVIEVRRNVVPGGGFVLIYSDITERKRSEEEIRAARDAAEAALRELKAAQTSLIHAEKMASLGQLTAGIAHEIKNPLNFVNNFAALSVELLDEFKEEAEPTLAALDPAKRRGIEETMALLTGNLQKIAEHGRRADGIVKSMLLHSRGGSGERQRVDLNALIEEALNLAYHGARAQDQSFNIALEREFDPALAPIEVVPQDMTRVFLNLFGNGFYAAAKRSRETGSSPVLKVVTRDLGASVEVRVRDNGVGIAPENRYRLFQPFFTTKPTGEGTGLGLSISYEIVKQGHGGTIDVDSEVGAFTEFVVRLPRNK